MTRRRRRRRYRGPRPYVSIGVLGPRAGCSCCLLQALAVVAAVAAGIAMVA